jgi:hypothetical protein
LERGVERLPALTEIAGRRKHDGVAALKTSAIMCGLAEPARTPIQSHPEAGRNPAAQINVTGRIRNVHHVPRSIKRLGK